MSSAAAARVAAVAEPPRHAGDLSPIDLECLSQRLAGQGELIRKTLSLFGEECERGLGELRRRIDSADLVGAAESAHRLKGSAGTVAADGLWETAARVEESCRRGRAAEVVAGFADLERAAARVMDHLHKVL
jgi:HPt (histidine-containing phosphotransfer) domain-containing protein